MKVGYNDKLGSYLGQFVKQFQDYTGYSIDLLSLQNEPDLKAGYASGYEPEPVVTILSANLDSVMNLF